MCCSRTFDLGDGVLSVLGLVLRCLSLGRVLHRVLVHARVSRQQPHVVFLAVVADGAPVSERLLHKEAGEELGGEVSLRKGQSRLMCFLCSHSWNCIFCYKLQMELYKQTQTVTITVTFSIQFKSFWSQMTITCLKYTYRTASHTIKDTQTFEET